jgi:hypothetical protein
LSATEVFAQITGRANLSVYKFVLEYVGVTSISIIINSVKSINSITHNHTIITSASLSATEVFAQVTGRADLWAGQIVVLSNKMSEFPRFVSSLTRSASV